MSEDSTAQQSPDNSPVKIQPAAAATGRLSAGPWLAVLFALLGGALTWLVFYAYYPIANVPMDLADSVSENMTSDQEQRIFAVLNNTNRTNTLFALAVVGALVGGGLGLAEGIARRSLKSVLAVTSLVAQIGTVAGITGGLLTDLIYINMKHFGDPLTLGGTILIHVISLAVLGAGIGFGLGASTGRAAAAGNCLLAGMLAGLGAGLIYPIVLAFVLPGAQTQVLVPAESGNQLIWIASIAVLLGIVIPGTASKRAPHSAAI
jgi:hypothetical protein